ncbi:hypothetical protein TNCV_2270051 [Trichonephila clavipes]|nr:hypothetical protein TNCV_2270051 [Trichonephila clavipes]
MSARGREFHNVCMRSKSSSFEASGHGSRARRQPTKSHTCSIGMHYPAERLLQGCLKGREGLRAVALHGRTCYY